MTEEKKSRDAEYWAKPVSELKLGHDVPAEAINLNVEGKRLAAMTGGFGKMWQKTYKISLEGTSVGPADVVKAWKANFARFWPKGARFYGPLTSISPGDVALLNLSVGGPAKLSTGIFVLYADDTSFSFVNPEGHMFVGMITFSSGTEDDQTVAQVQALIRAGDPLYEMGMPMMHRKEDKFWTKTLENLAAHFGVSAKADKTKVLVDRKRQWDQWRNIRKNAGVRTALHMFGAPFRAIAKPFKGKKETVA
ncbi:MAG: hypothetical protein WD646_08430 [Actinomycetota bacterium]